MTGTTLAASAAQANPLRKRAAKILKGELEPADKYMPDHEEVVEIIEHLRQMGCVIAFMSGNWDLYHIGHARYIYKGKKEAKKLYPEEHVILVVGIDTDEMTRRRKGNNRPIVQENHRAEQVAYHEAVDIIVPQHEPDQLFKLIKHHVRIVSVSTKDLPDLSIVKAECEHLVNLEPQAETSTTARIRRLAIDGVYERLGPYLAKLKPIVDEMSGELERVEHELKG